jgi:hypothetical protein
VVLAVVLLTTPPLAAAGVTAAATPGHAERDASHASVDAGTRQVTPANESNVTRHEDPADVGQPGDLQAVEGWLAGRMSTALVDCAEGARAQSAGVCDLDGEYPDWLGRYVDVARETDARRDDNASAGFRDARRHQTTFNERVSEFRRTHEAYRAARDAGDTARARRLARRLLVLRSGVTNASDALVRDYRVISNNTEANPSRASATVRAVEGNVTETTADVAADLFVETSLTVTGNDSRASFTDPLRIEGRLTAENGTALAGRPVGIAVGERRLRTTTDEAGRFTATYRPATVGLDADAVRVRYEPQNDSAYLAASARVPVTVEQVRPTVTVSRTPDSVGFVDALAVRGRVGANGTGAADVPVAVTLGGARIGTTRTTDDGRYVVRGLVPATVGSGTRPVRATVRLDNRALAGTSNATTVTVTTTPTTVTATGTADGPRTIRVRGTLTTADGTPMPGQSVTVAVADERVARLTAGRGGRYDGRVTVPADVPANAAASVEVRYLGAGTNLEPSRAVTTVALPATSDGGDTGAVRDRLPGGDGTGVAILAALGLLVALLGGGYALAGRVRPWGIGPGDAWARAVALVGTGAEDGVDGASPPAGSEREPATGESDDGSPADGPTPALVTYAREQIETGDPDRGVVAAYVAARRALAGRVDDGRARTHWEFFDACAGALNEDERDRLRTLTEAFERAAFASTTVSRDAARDLLTVSVSFTDP